MERPGNAGPLFVFDGRLAILAQDSEHTPLNGYLGGGYIDWLHFDIGWLQTDDMPFCVVAF